MPSRQPVPVPEDSREGGPRRVRRVSRPRLRWPGQRRGRWRPRLARRRPWLGRQPDGTCPPAPPPRPARRSSPLAGVMWLCVGRSRALLCPPLAGANGAPARAGQGPCPSQDLRFKRTSPLDSPSGRQARLRWPAAPKGFVPQPLGLLASTALPSPGQASGFAVGPVTGLAGAPRWRLRPHPGQPQALRPSLPPDSAVLAGTPRLPALGGQG